MSKLLFNGYTVFLSSHCASLFSSSLRVCCPSSGHWDKEMPVLGFWQALLSMYERVYEDKCHVLTLLTLAFPSLPPCLSTSPPVHVSVGVLSPFAVLYTFTWSPFSNFSQKVNACSACSSWISANVVQPTHSCISLSLLLSCSLSGTSHQVATHSSIGAALPLWHHTTSHEASIPAQINLIAVPTEAKTGKTWDSIS